jgi:hypothetical protein
MMTPEDTMVFAQFAFVTVTSLGALTGIGIGVHSYLRRARRKELAAAPQYAEDDRLQRLEQAVDSIAIEVERISEGQRFLTRLQTEHAQDRALGS